MRTFQELTKMLKIIERVLGPKNSPIWQYALRLYNSQIWIVQSPKPFQWVELVIHVENSLIKWFLIIKSWDFSNVLHITAAKHHTM